MKSRSCSGLQIIYCAKEEFSLHGNLCPRFWRNKVQLITASEAIRSLKPSPLKKMGERSGRGNNLLEQQRLKEQREEALLYAWVEQAHREGLERERDKAERRARRPSKKKRRRLGGAAPKTIPFLFGFELLPWKCLWQACGVSVPATHEGWRTEKKDGGACSWKTAWGNRGSHLPPAARSLHHVDELVARRAAINTRIFLKPTGKG